ncbi:cupin domain-containing protein [Nonomuraea sp. NPDC049028]|uniref:cupin domain-containing protein n=1 Tax=Nonomuraea sp. NPDC049028 TaxID=3364348 RepID=UPI0037233AE8
MATSRTIEDGEAAMNPRSCGIAESGSAVLLSGAYQVRAGISDRLLNALPDMVVITDDEDCSPLLRLARDNPFSREMMTFVAIRTFAGLHQSPHMNSRLSSINSAHWGSGPYPSNNAMRAAPLGLK